LPSAIIRRLGHGTVDITLRIDAHLLPDAALAERRRRTFWCPRRLMKRFHSAMVRLRREVKAALEDGARCESPRTSGNRAEILRVEESLLTFARVEGVPPTNNAAERALRHAVI
jgi:Transposase IS66 family